MSPFSPKQSLSLFLFHFSVLMPTYDISIDNNKIQSSSSESRENYQKKNKKNNEEKLSAVLTQIS